MKKKTFQYTMSVAVITAMFQVTPAWASQTDSQLQGQIDATKGQIQNTQGQISNTQGQIDDLETKVQKLDNQITFGMVKSEKLSDNIQAQQKQIDGTKTQIDKAQQDLDVHKQFYSERLKSIQAQGQSPIVTYAELLLSSKDLSEFLTRSSAIMEVLQNDSDIMASLNQKENTLEQAEQQKHAQMDKLQKSREELASEHRTIESDKQQILIDLAQSKSILEQQQSQLSQQQGQLSQQQSQMVAQQKAEEEAHIQAQIKAQQEAQQKAQEEAQRQAELKRQQEQQSQQQQAQQPSLADTSAPAPSVSTGGTSNLSPSALADAVVAKAEQYLGVPYVWGGTTPSGFDCSGLVQYAYRSVGIDIPRVSEDQQNFGKTISPYDVQKGDLVFLGDPAYHVGMYIGGGQWIEAPQTGDVVKIVHYNPAHFTSATRIIQ